MEILFRREQTSGKFSRVIFKLWCKLETGGIEAGLIQHYSLDEAVLIDAWEPELLKKSAYVGLGVAVLIASIMASSTGFGNAIFFGLLFGAGAGYFYYDRNRETIFVKDLLHGRYFECGSIVDLASKEAWLETISGFLRQVMESSKHWDGTETRDIQPLPKDEAKWVMIRGV